MSRLAQVSAAQTATGGGASERVQESEDIGGRKVLTAYAPVAPLGWLVFVELPVAEAYAQRVLKRLARHITNLDAAQRLFDLRNVVSLIEFKIDDIYQAPAVAETIRQAAGPGFDTTTWMEQNHSLFAALRLERLVGAAAEGHELVVGAMVLGGASWFECGVHLCKFSSVLVADTRVITEVR